MADRLTSEDLGKMVDEILSVGGVIHGPQPASIINAYDIWILQDYTFKQETAELAYKYRGWRNQNQQWKKAYKHYGPA